MSQPIPLRAYALRGRDAAVALDWLHVHADVTGVLEQSDEVVVWLTSPLALPAAELGLELEIEERAVRAADFAHTGLEDDAVVQVAPDLVVRPPWVASAIGFAGIELVVPRGGAFGSGEHDSTRAALLAMHRTWAGPASCADVGTGTGILALYAHVRGCPSIVACDIDAPSVTAARELLPSSRVYLGGAETLDRCDLVVANMTGDELMAALPAILAAWNRRGLLILSGMRGPEVATLTTAVAMPIVHREVEGEFTALVWRPSAQVR